MAVPGNVTASPGVPASDSVGAAVDCNILFFLIKPVRTSLGMLSGAGFYCEGLGCSSGAVVALAVRVDAAGASGGDAVEHHRSRAAPVRPSPDNGTRSCSARPAARQPQIQEAKSSGEEPRGKRGGGGGLGVEEESLSVICL